MPVNKADEEVLVISEARFQAAGIFHGFRNYTAEYYQTLLDPTFFSYRPRGEVESDPTFKQLIPYVVLRCRGEVFQYKRGSGGGEQRLQSLRSIGIGGHINPADGGLHSDPYRGGMLRELREEVQIDGRFTEHCLGFIYDDRSLVGSVHLGIVHLFDLEEPLVWPREAAIDDSSFARIRELRQYREEFETWSQFVLEMLEDH